MPIADVNRAYVPTVNYIANLFQQKTLANIQAMTGYPNRILAVTVPTNLVHRKIWAWFLSVSGTYSTDVDVVAVLNGTTVYQQKLIVQNTAAVNLKYQFNVGQLTANFGGQREQIITTVATTTNFGICPFHLNIACDTFAFVINSLTGAAAAWDAALHVQSQAGI